MTPTPITDAEEKRQAAQYNDHREPGDPSFPADFDFARKLERQLAQATQSLADAQSTIRQLLYAVSDLHAELATARRRLYTLGSATSDLPGTTAIKRWCQITK